MSNRIIWDEVKLGAMEGSKIRFEATAAEDAKEWNGEEDNGEVGPQKQLDWTVSF